MLLCLSQQSKSGRAQSLRWKYHSFTFDWKPNSWFCAKDGGAPTLNFLSAMINSQQKFVTWGQLELVEIFVFVLLCIIFVFMQKQDTWGQRDGLSWWRCPPGRSRSPRSPARSPFCVCICIWDIWQESQVTRKTTHIIVLKAYKPLKTHHKTRKGESNRALNNPKKKKRPVPAPSIIIKEQSEKLVHFITPLFCQQFV